MSIADKLQTIAENEQKVYDAGVADGRQAEYDEFWRDALDHKSHWSNKMQFAGKCWTDKTFNPPSKKYAVWNAQNLFAHSHVTDLAAIFERNGFSLNTSTCEVFDSMYYQSKVTHAPVTDCSAGIYMSVFWYATSLVVIDGIIFPNKAPNSYNNMFGQANALEEISYIEGSIFKSISFSSCTKLNHDTIMRVINALYDYVAEGSTTTYTLTLGTTNLAKLTDEEKAIATQKGWTLA